MSGRTVPTWEDLRAETERALAGGGVAAPAAEARWILEEVSGYASARFHEGGSEPATATAAARLAGMIERRLAGEPLQYVLGTWSFRGIDLLVDRRVLVPRPETEVTVEVAIEEAVRLGARRGRPDPWSANLTDLVVADLGTGSGAIAISLAAELPDALVWATDASPDALAVARANLAGAGQPATRVRLAEGSWYDALPHDLRGNLRLVVSNPPYVAEHEVGALPPDVRDHEPRTALVGGPEGLDALARVVAGAPDWLEPGGTLVCELAPHQAPAVTGLARRAGFTDVEVRPDLAGRPRVLVARRRPSHRPPPPAEEEP